MVTTIHAGDITSGCLTCAHYSMPDDLHVVNVSRIEHDTTNGLEWWAAYVMHADGSHGWQLTTDGTTFTPREILPVAR